jgi:hypothetical protein
MNHAATDMTVDDALSEEQTFKVIGTFGRLLRAVATQNTEQIQKFQESLYALGWDVRCATAGKRRPKRGSKPEARQEPSRDVSLVRLAKSIARLAIAGVEPAIGLDDWAVILRCSRRTVEGMRAESKIPPPDLSTGKKPLWLAATVREYLEGQVARGRK